MNTPRILLLAALLPLAACSPVESARSATEQATTAAAEAMSKTSGAVIEKARRELAEGDIEIGEGQTKAKISAKGDLLVDGKPVPVNETQRALLLAHRGNIVAVAEAGIAIGMQGANLGTRAASGALKNIFGGNAEEFGKQMEAEGARIEAQALKICDLLPPLLESQQALAAALPAFVPYATMDQSDVTDCASKRRADNNPAFQAGRHLGRALAQTGTPSKATDSEGEADAETDEAAPAMNAAAEADKAAARR